MSKKQSLSRSINHIAQLIYSTGESNEVVKRILSEGAKAVGSETATITSRQGDRWFVSHVHGLPEGMIGAWMDDQQEPQAVLAIETKKPVVIADAFTDARGNCEHMKRRGVRSSLVMPLVAEDQVVGVLSFNRHKAGMPFNQADADLATQLASSLPLILHKTRPRNDLQARDCELMSKPRTG